MINCPTCLIPVDGLRCPQCGFTEPGTTPGRMDRLCQNVDRGLRCSNPGSFSHSTFGTGPWLCWSHFAPNAARFKDGLRTGPPGGFSSLHDQLRKAAPAKPDFELLAERAAIAAPDA